MISFVRLIHPARSRIGGEMSETPKDDTNEPTYCLTASQLNRIIQEAIAKYLLYTQQGYKNAAAIVAFEEVDCLIPTSRPQASDS